LLLPDELVTQIIIHSIKDESVFHFLNLPAHQRLWWGTTARVIAWSSWGVQESLHQVVLWAALPWGQSFGGIVLRGDGEFDEAEEPR
jgi:hypothetical protein